MVARLFLSGAVLLAMAACTKFTYKKPSDHYIGYGVYHARMASDSAMVLRLTLSQNGTYLKRCFIGPCLVSETSGKWNSDHETIEFRMQRMRIRSDCDSPWEERDESRVSRRLFRSVSPASFDLLDDGEGMHDPEWLSFSRRTY